MDFLLIFPVGAGFSDFSGLSSLPSPSSSSLLSSTLKPNIFLSSSALFARSFSFLVLYVPSSFCFAIFASLASRFACFSASIRSSSSFRFRSSSSAMRFCSSSKARFSSSNFSAASRRSRAALTIALSFFGGGSFFPFLLFLSFSSFSAAASTSPAGASAGASLGSDSTLAVAFLSFFFGAIVLASEGTRGSQDARIPAKRVQFTKLKPNGLA
mmetsp:Transcript_41932/g.82967  ORF Transcript_41932/g.82967 Transcript_41932/m.82967 type:complete len:213 (+) Transcript_41932:2182-2820(+)